MQAALTLTPEVAAYAVVTLWLLGGCAPSLASRLHEGWGARRGIGFFVIYATTLASVSLLGVLAFGSPLLRLPHAVWLLASLAAAVPLAGLAFSANLRIMRWRRRAASRSAAARRAAPAVEGHRAVVKPVRRGTRARVQASEKAPSRPVQGTAPEPPSRLLLVLVAALEEVVFRGLLFGFAIAQGTATAAILASLSLLLFCVGHVHYGPVEALGKLPLGLVATLTTWLLGSVVLAVLVHVAFNLRVFRTNEEAVRRMPVAAVGGAS